MVNLDVPRSENSSEIISVGNLNTHRTNSPASSSTAPSAASPTSGGLSEAVTLSLRHSSPSGSSTSSTSSSSSSSSRAAAQSLTGRSSTRNNTSPSKFKRTILKKWKCFKKPTCKRILWWLLFFGFTIDHLVRININVVIAQMIENNYLKTNSTIIIKPSTNFTQPFVLKTNNNLTQSRFAATQSILDYFLIEYNPDDFLWNEHEQAHLFASFFWLNWLSQIPGALLSKFYGPKYVFGFANLLASCLCAFIPFLIYLESGRWLIYLRILQGFICGFSTGAIYMIIGRWIPINERSEFLNVTHGSILAIIFLYPTTGYLLTTNVAWEWPYFMTAFIGIIWFINWYYFIYSSPSDHPRISIRELNRIDHSLGTPVSEPRELKSIPWQSILTCRYVWIIAIIYFGNQWCSTTLVTQLPIYFRYIYKWPIDFIGYIICTMHFIKFISGHTISILGNNLIKNQQHHKYIGINSVRRFAGLLCCICQGIFILILSSIESGLYGPIILYILAIICDSAVTTGPMASVIDINPQYAGITMGLITMISLIGPIGSPYIVGNLTQNNQTIEQWINVFIITGTIGILFGIPYTLGSVAKKQNWNESASSGGWSLNNRREVIFPDMSTNETEIDVQRQFAHQRIERRQSLPTFSQSDREEASITSSPLNERIVGRFLVKNRNTQRGTQTRPAVLETHF